MGQVLVRNLDDDVIDAIRLRAELKGASLEQELRDIITAAAKTRADNLRALAVLRTRQSARSDLRSEDLLRDDRLSRE